jgi:hypothetical protein
MKLRPIVYTLTVILIFAVSIDSCNKIVKIYKMNKKQKEIDETRFV